MVFTHATRVRVPDGEFWPARGKSKKKKRIAPAGNQTRVSSVAGMYIITILPARSALSVPRLELGTSRVLGERHDQLDHTDRKSGVSGFRSQYLVLAKDARFRLRQYPDAARRAAPAPALPADKKIEPKRFGVSGFRSLYLVLAKDARFRLRQYPVAAWRACRSLLVHARVAKK